MRAAFDALGAWGAAAGMAEVTSNADESHVPEPYCFRAVFISDLHLGTPGCQATALLDFLKHHPSKTLYLVGDIVDGWQLRRRWFWPQAHNDVVQKLALFRFGWSATVQKNLLTPPEQEPFRCKKHCFAKR